MNTTKEEKKKHKILIKVKVHGSRQHSTCSFMPACLLRTLVDTNVLLLCTLQLVQGRLKAVLLCLRYVDTVAFSARFVPSWCAQKKKQVRKQNFVVVRVTQRPWRTQS